jgi:hypothetical protein
MCKSNKKNNNYNKDIINELVARFDVTSRYVIMSIVGDRSGTLSIKIQEEYKQLDAASKKAIAQKLNTL